MGIGSDTAQLAPLALQPANQRSSQLCYKGKTRHIERLFRHLGYEQYQTLPKSANLWGQKVHLSAAYLSSQEYLLIVSNTQPDKAWPIETLFKAFKSQGFDFESARALTLNPPT